MHEKRYTRLKLKMLLLVLTGAVVVCALSLFLVEVVVDGFLQDPVSRLFVWVATNLFGQSTEVALDAYETYIRANKSEILSLGLVVLMLLAFYVAMGRFTTWLEEIRWATHSLADTAEEEIRLPGSSSPWSRISTPSAASFWPGRPSPRRTSSGSGISSPFWPTTSRRP